jgi:hypothetical protein
VCERERKGEERRRCTGVWVYRRVEKVKGEREERERFFPFLSPSPSVFCAYVCDREEREGKRERERESYGSLWWRLEGVKGREKREPFFFRLLSPERDRETERE